MRIKTMFFFIILSLFYAKIITAKNAPAITFDGESLGYLGKKILVLSDKNKNYTPHEAYSAHGYETYNTNVPNLGLKRNPVWVKFKVKNQSNDDQFLLELSYSILDKVVLFQLNDSTGKFNKTAIGQEIPFSKRKYKHQNFIFDLNIPKGETRDFLLKIKSNNQILLPIKIGNEKTIFEALNNKDLLFGIYLGVFIVVFFYNLFLYLFVKDQSYLYYVVYILFVGLTQAAFHGYTYRLFWPENMWLVENELYLLSFFVGIASVEFLKNFLNTKNYVPILHKVFYGFYALYFISIVLLFIDYPYISWKLIQVVVTVLSLYMLFVAYKVIKKGSRTAKFFLVAWSVFLIGIFIYTLRDFGILPYNMWVTYTMPAGSAIEAVLLSIALADRINILKKEKEESKAYALAVSQENERIIREHSQMLEERVKERTVELQQSNEELSVALNNLKETQTQLVNSEKMASLGQLTAGVAHEINNPINFVTSNVTPLQRDIDDIFTILNKYEEITHNKLENGHLKEINSLRNELEPDFLKDEIYSLIKGINEGATRTADIVKGLRNFSRVDQNELKYADIHENIDSTLTLLNNKLKERIEIQKNYGDLQQVECYSGKLNQVFMNILNNAIQAIKGKGKITIDTWQENKNIYIKITDNGMGMSEETKSHIFEPFFTTKEIGVGTGLGMSISYGIIKDHNGDIKVETEIEKGTTFTIILPVSQN